MNISISEILVVLLIALLVIKPEQLPEVAVTLGRFAKAIQNMFSKVKGEMNSFIDSVDKPVEQTRERK